jgi:hypothetical protein
MRRASLSLVLAFLALALAASAGATIYAGPQQWYSGQSAGSSYGKWTSSDFAKVSSGYDTTATFIDNVTYSWHGTVRNTAQVTHAYYFGPETRKGHCRAHVSYFWGSCAVN